VRKILSLLIAFPAGVLLVALAIANRHSVPLVLDPFNPEDPALALALPFYAYLLGAIIVGVLLGGAAAWLAQSHWRRAARARGQEARRWHAEADRLTRERDAAVQPKQKQLAVAGR
jgi:uncharacterized integral membrane protein